MSSVFKPGKTTRLLAIGYLPPPMGGVSVSFKIFCDLAAENGKIDLEVIDLSNRKKDRSLLRGTFKLIWRIWVQMGGCDVVSLYCATPQVASAGLLTLVFCRLRGKTFILRKAAGVDYRALGVCTGRVAEFVVKHADLFLAETRHLTELCLRRGVVRTKWFPTNRPMGPLPGKPPEECHRFVYLGQVRPSKGAFELVAAAEHLPESATLDVYGPFFDGIDETLFRGLETRVEYKGIVDPDEVIATLRNYDALVLPSKASTEGYPGIILEAFSIGIPVIATNIGGIPEMIDERCGILVEPGDNEALVHAMHRLAEDKTTYHKLCKGALEARERFSAEYWTEWLVQECLRMSKKTEQAS